MAADAFTYGGALAACTTAGRWQESLRLWDAMAAAHVPANTVCLYSLLSALARAGRREHACQVRHENTPTHTFLPF